MSDDTEGLQAAIEREHGGTATFIGTELVTAIWQGRIAWQGVVQIYALTGEAQFKTVYAWLDHPDGSGAPRRVHTALRAGSINTPWDAVNAAIVANYRPIN
jgi:hypothetical protein